jgi:hypothetical protein
MNDVNDMHDTKDANKLARFLVVLFALAVGSFLASGAHAQGKKTAAGEEFFMISSTDSAKSQILLKRPTEVTQLMKVSDKTQFVDEKGKPFQLTGLRAGDTVWVTSSRNDNGDLTAIRVRKGPMTVQDLHRYFLDYPEIR